MAGPLIAVWSPKGGVGKTLIAAGLAIHLVRRAPGQTILIDLDAGKADVAPLLQTPLRPSILEYPSGSGQTVSHPSGVQVLPGPARLVDEGLVTGDLAAAVLQRAAAEANAVVVDVDADLRDSTVIALERADAVLLVTTPDLLSIYPARRFAQEAGLIGIDVGKFRLVINRVTARQAIPDEEIADLTGLTIAGRVPSLPGLAAAVNRGMVTTLMRSNTDFAVALAEIADALAFAGIPRRQASEEAGAAPDRRERVGLIPALRRWWRSL